MISILIPVYNNSCDRLVSDLHKQAEALGIEFEIIVMDDCSTDDSQLVLSELKSQYPQLYYTTIPIDNKFNHSKKLAVIVAMHEIALTVAKTEARIFFVFIF